MKLLAKRSSAGNNFALVILSGLWLVVGCDMGLEQSSNRYERLNDETTKLLKVLEQINNEATATEHQAELEKFAEKIRGVQKKINEAAGKEGTGMGRITNARQAELSQSTGDSARRLIDHIRETDAKAGAIVDKALEGVEFPRPDSGLPTGLGR